MILDLLKKKDLKLEVLKANKIVFYLNKKWIIIDVQELHSYIKKNNMKDINIEELINNLEWNITL